MALDHTFGAILGFAGGDAMLKLGWVDCENWDIFAVMEGRAGRPKAACQKDRGRRNRLVSSEYRDGRRSPRARRKARAGQRLRSRRSRTVRPPRCGRSGMHLELGESRGGPGRLPEVEPIGAGWQPPEPDWRDLIEALVRLTAPGTMRFSVMRDYVRDLAQPSPRVLLKLAQILIQKQGRPQQGLKILAQIPAGLLARRTSRRSASSSSGMPRRCARKVPSSSTRTSSDCRDGPRADRGASGQSLRNELVLLEVAIEQVQIAK